MVSHGARTIATIAVVLAATMLAAPGASAQTYWFESYEKVVDLVGAGRYTEASAILDGVLEQHPAPIATVRLPGARFIEYVPYYYHAQIDFSLGRIQAASHYLDVSEAFGEPTFSRDCQRDSLKLRQAIDSLRVAVTAQASLPASSLLEATPASSVGRPETKRP